jgi:hypothetical protein
LRFNETRVKHEAITLLAQADHGDVVGVHAGFAGMQ